MPISLDQLVTVAATELMAATADNHALISQRVLADLADHFDVDSGFLRHTDHTIRATVLVAEWPPRNKVPDPDPLRVVYFADADPVFAMIEHRDVPLVLRPEAANVEFQRYIAQATAVPATSLAAVPLLSRELITGTLGFIKFGDRQWDPDELNALQAIATLFAQVQARIVAEQRLQYLAEHDELTGLPNRRVLTGHLDDRLAQSRSGPVSVLLVDVDRLKVIIDYRGHDAADRFIKAFAQLLRETVEAAAIVARVDGDEFAVVPTAAMDTNAGEALAQSLQTLLQRQIPIDGDAVSRTVSFGVAAGIPGRDTSSVLLRRAERAMQSAKNSGGNAVSRFDPQMSETYAIRNDIEMQLERLIEGDTGALLLHYLPEFDLRTGEVVGTEALLRWRHPSRGILMPDSFMDVVESINLAAPLGRLVARSAAAQFKVWHSRGLGRDVMLSINISPAQLVAHGIVERVTETVEENGLDPSKVCLEITERAVVQDITTTHKALAGLKETGVQIAIDDFGTGYSALTYLKSLPVDTLKIDREFVRDLGTDPADLTIVRSIVALAHGLGLDVVAEGVETAAAATTLLDLGCHRAQGFLLSRPLDNAAMESLLARGSIPLDF